MSHTNDKLSTIENMANNFQINFKSRPKKELPPINMQMGRGRDTTKYIAGGKWGWGGGGFQ